MSPRIRAIRLFQDPRTEPDILIYPIITHVYRTARGGRLHQHSKYLVNTKISTQRTAPGRAETKNLRCSS